VREFPEQVGNYLTEMVLKRIARSDLVRQHVTIPTELVKRESCRPLSSDIQVTGQEQSHEMQSSPDA
jgi:hypothetical protein